MPGGAIGADLEVEIIISGKPYFRPPRKTALIEQCGRVRYGVLVDFESVTIAFMIEKGGRT